MSRSKSPDDLVPRVPWDFETNEKFDLKQLVDRGGPLALLLATCFLATAIIRYGWISDDGFIVARSLQRAVAGDGLVLNLGQRVQTFTSPLWTLLCLPLYAATRNPYTTLVAAGLIASAGLIALIVWGYKGNPWRAAVLSLALCSSASFLAYSTSGLENALAHLLTTAFFFERLHVRGLPTRWGGVLAALLVLTRIDYAFLVILPTLYACWLRPKRILRTAWPGLLLLAAWFLFAIVYYGAFLPNTAYAKLNTTIPLAVKMARGVAYWVDSFYRDPVLGIVFGAGLAVVVLRRIPPVLRVMASAAYLYAFYLLLIGGDFMSGRFLTVPYILTLLALTHVKSVPKICWVALFPFVLLPAFNSWQDRRAEVPRNECNIGPAGIADERPCYLENMLLSQNISAQKWRDHGYFRDYEKAIKRDARDGVIVFGLVGMIGFSNGPDLHIVEPMALSEPLLARLKVQANSRVRPGHFARPIPQGYVESLRSGKNLIKDPCIRDLYERVHIATTGPLFTMKRLRAIYELHTHLGTCPISI